MSKLLIIENCNFKDYPPGGTLSFAKQLMQELPSRKITLVGITTEDIKIREWTTIKIGDQSFEFFPIIKLDPSIKKPFIPLRLKSFFALLYSLKKIRKKPYRFVFTQTPQFIFALSLFQWRSICFCFAGLGNSVKLSRYRSLRFLGLVYETILLRLLNNHTDCIFAAADTESILKFREIHKAILKKEIISFPTRFDENIFYPRDKRALRTKLKLPLKKTILVTTGRLCWIKGWDLLLEVLLLRLKENNTLLFFVGDGEDRSLIEERYPNLYNKYIFITGFVDPVTVAEYINASDVFILGSYTEGWSTSLIEALACGKPIVTTDVSSAHEIVKEGVTGYIVKERNALLFNFYIEEALKLNDVELKSKQIANKYSKSKLYHDFTSNWTTVKEILQ
jgi:glycosyltransferase involved in cell wall biosynthesis